MKYHSAAATLLITVLSYSQVAFAHSRQEAQITDEKIIIAIVDFKNTSADSELDYLEKTIPEAISTTMARSGRLEIVERGRLEEALREMEMSMLGIVDEETAVEVGRAVGANTILVGSFVSIGAVIRINTRLIDVQTGKVIKAESVQGLVGEEIFDLMDTMALSMEQQLMGELEAEATPHEEETLPAQAVEQPVRGEDVRNIRARLAAQSWQGKKIYLTLTDGRQVAGLFVKADFQDYTLKGKNKQVVIPIDDITTITIKPGLVEAGIALVAGVLGGGLAASIAALTGAEQPVPAAAAVLGAGAGLWWGFKTFYETIVIELDEQTFSLRHPGYGQPNVGRVAGPGNSTSGHIAL